MKGYKERSRGLPACPPRLLHDLSLAADALGETLVFGSELSFELQAAAQNPKHPVHSAAGDSANHQLFVLLQAMLISERWLIEFLLGPPNQKQDDICVDCFSHDWRFPAGVAADELARRRSRINKLVLHPTWEFIDFSARNWTVNRIAACADGLEVFAKDIQSAIPTVAGSLQKHVARARSALASGRPDGQMWLQLQAHSSLHPPLVV